MDKTYKIKVQSINDNVILCLLDYGTVEAIIQTDNTIFLRADENSQELLKSCHGVINVTDI
jgi:hypothetical protein